MPKTKVKITTKSNNITDTYEIKALLKDNKLMYYEPNKTKVIFDYENNDISKIENVEFLGDKIVLFYE